MFEMHIMSSSNHAALLSVVIYMSVLSAANMFVFSLSRTSRVCAETTGY